MENKIIKDDEIDLIALVKAIWKGRKVFAFIIGLFVIVGIIISYTSPVLYKSNATLLPSIDKKNSGLGNLGALAGMAGINVSNLMGESSVIPAELYPQIVSSTPFLIGLMSEKVNWSDNLKMSFYERTNLENDLGTCQLILKYTIKLPITIKDWIVRKEAINASIALPKSGDYIVLSEKENMTIQKLSNSINLDYVKSTGIVNLSILLDDRVAVAELTARAHMLLERYIIDYRTKYAQENVNFLESRVSEKKVLYEQSQRAYYEYRDSHRDMITERIDFDFQRISDAFNIESNVYKSLLQQLEQAKLSLKEETPAFSVIDPVILPLEKSKPQRALILMFALFTGFIFYTALLYFMHITKNSCALEKYRLYMILKKWFGLH